MLPSWKGRGALTINQWRFEFQVESVTQPHDRGKEGQTCYRLSTAVDRASGQLGSEAELVSQKSTAIASTIETSSSSAPSCELNLL